MTVRPAIKLHPDPLADLFGSMGIQDAIHRRVEATAPWGIRYSGDKGLRVRFGLVVRGAAFLKFKNQRRTIPLSSGDLGIFILNNEPFTLTDHPRSPIGDFRDVRKLEIDGVVRFGGGGGSLTTMVSGSFGMSEHEAPLISTILPRFLHLRLGQNRSQAFQAVLNLLASEVAQPDISPSCLISLYELLFVFAIRAYASSPEAPPKGWLAAMSDKHLSKAIQAMHSSLDRSWSVASLAREARMSRSAFASKFKTVLGLTPLEYVTQWRMYKAGAMIRSNNSSFSEVASAVGYGSASSFSRVFSREMGAAPREYRRKCADFQSSVGE
jgi:AraC-like DNA-binding protein